MSWQSQLALSPHSHLDNTPCHSLAAKFIFIMVFINHSLGQEGGSGYLLSFRMIWIAFDRLCCHKKASWLLLTRLWHVPVCLASELALDRLLPGYTGAELGLDYVTYIFIIVDWLRAKGCVF